MDTALKRWLLLWGAVLLAAVAAAAATGSDHAYLSVLIALGMLGAGIYGRQRHRP